MCKSTSLGPVQAETAKVDITEDNSSSFINVHLPSMTYLGAVVLLVIMLVIGWKWMSSRRKKSAHKQRVTELQLQNVARNVADIPSSVGAQRATLDRGDTLRVSMQPSSRIFKALEEPGF